MAIASYVGDGTSFDNAMKDFARAYADQNEHDYAVLQTAVTEGRISVLRDV